MGILCPMKSKLHECYMRSFDGGQTKFARYLDFVLINILRFMAAYLLVRTKLRQREASVFVAIIITVIIALIANIIRDMRFERHVAKLREGVREELIKKKLMYVDSAQILRTIEPLYHGECIVFQRFAPIEADIIYSVVRYMYRSGIENLHLFTTSTLTDDAKNCIEDLDGMMIECIQLCDIPELKELANVSQAETDEAIIRKYGKKPKVKPRLSEIFAYDRSKKYFSAGVMLMLLSFIMSNGVYMRVISSLAFTIAGTIFIREKLMDRRSN